MILKSVTTSIKICTNNMSHHIFSRQVLLQKKVILIAVCTFTAFTAGYQLFKYILNVRYNLKNKQVIEKATDWKNQFKSNVTQHLADLQSSNPHPLKAVTLNLTPEQTRILREAIVAIYSGQSTPAIIHGGNIIYVISIPQIPGVIFKFHREDVEENFEERMKATAKAQDVVEKNNLNLLHVPAQCLTSIEVENTKIPVLIEQQFDIIHDQSSQYALYHYCATDSDLQPFFQEYVRQLIILILETGYMDVRVDNNPILTNGTGLALVDMDESTSPITGLLYGCTITGREGILNYLSLSMLEKLDPLLKEKLSPEDYEKLNIDTLKTRLSQEENRNREFQDYLNDHKIVTAQEPVRFQNRFFSFFRRSSQNNPSLEKRINTLFLNNKGICPVSERKLYIYDEPDKQKLTQLKNQKKIFDWENLASESRSRYGYYIWC